MELAIQEQRENPLLKREEYVVEADHTGEPTPSANTIRKQFAAENDEDPETIEVSHIYTGFGNNTSRADVTVHEEPVVDTDGEVEEDAAEEEGETEKPEEDEEE
jgi:ribosomal protein S24E